MRREIETSGPLKSIHRYKNESLHEWVYSEITTLMQREKKRDSTRMRTESEAFLAGLAQLNLAYPFRLEDLRGIDTTRRVGVQDGVYHIATTGLRMELRLCEAQLGEVVLTRCNVSIGAYPSSCLRPSRYRW